MSEMPQGEQPPAPSTILLVPLILGASLLAVGVLGSYRYWQYHAMKEMRNKLYAARDHLKECRSHLQAKNGPAAEASARGAIAHAPHLATAHTFLGEALQLQRRYAEALAAYTIALDQQSDDTDRFLAHLGRARAYLKLDKIPEAADDLDSALALQPYNGEAYLLRAAVRMQKGDVLGAREDQRRARELGATVPAPVTNAPQ